MKCATAALMALLIVAPVAAQVVDTGRSPSAALIGQVGGSDDTDHFHAWLFRGGALLHHASYLEYRGVAAQDTHYSQAGWNRDAGAILALWRDQRRDTLTGVNVEAGIVQVAGHTRPLGDATWSLRPTPGTGVELIAAGGLVETRAALDRGIGYTFWAVSAEQALAERLTAIGLIGAQPFSDGNSRIHVRARLVWDMLPDYGINAQVRWRAYESRKLDVDGAYFNPDRYQQSLAAIGFRQRHGSWVWSGTLAAGEQQIQGSGHQPSYLAEVHGEASLAHDVRVAVNLLYSRAAAYSASPDYWYGLVGLNVIVPF